MTKVRRTAVRTIRGSALSVRQVLDAIRGREERGWMKDRADSTGTRERLHYCAQGSPVGSFSGCSSHGGSRSVGFDRGHLSEISG
jgi:hypothetical protein